MLRSVMRTTVRAIARVETHDISNADMDIYLDEGYDHVQAHQVWPWMIAAATDDHTLVAGTQAYSTGATVKQVLAVMNVTNDYQLRGLSFKQFIRYSESVSSNGTPTHYYFTEGTIRLFPTPQATDDIEISFIENPVFSTGESGEPAFNSIFHRLLVDWALHRLWEIEEDMDRSAEYRARFEDGLMKMADWYNEEMQDTPLIYGESKGASRSSNMPFLDNPAVI